MHTEFLSDLIDGFSPFNRFQSNLGFLRADKNLTLFSLTTRSFLSQATILNYCPDIGIHFTLQI